MSNERKLELLQIIVDRVNQNMKVAYAISSRLARTDLPALWPELEKTMLDIVEDLRIALPLAAEAPPSIVSRFGKMKEAIVNLRIACYNKMNDVAASKASGKPVHQEARACEAMLAHGISDAKSERGIQFCLKECPYQRRCIAIEPASGEN